MTCWLCAFKNTKLEVNGNVVPMCKNGPCQICIAVEKVDDEINQAIATLRRLIAKRCDLRSEQNHAHGTLIQRLPVELKTYIFRLLLPSRNGWGEIQGSEKTVSASFLASICRVWRDIAWSNPSFWTIIRVDANGEYSTPFDLPHLVDIIHDRVLRSQSLPLNLFISSNGSEEQLQDIIYTISQYSNRWLSLSINMPLTLLHSFRCDLHDAPLQSLRINVPSRLAIDDQPIPFLDMSMNPEVIEIAGLSFRSLRISWNRLTTAKVKWFDWEDIAQLFQHASQMTYCHISLPISGPENFSMPTITHQRLKTLSLPNPFLPTHLLNFLTLPSLEEFHGYELSGLPALVHRSACPLTRITLLNGIVLNLDGLPSLRGVTDLFVEAIISEARAHKIKYLIEEVLPDMRNLTLRPRAFQFLWRKSLVPLLLDLKRPDGLKERRLDKFGVLVLGLDRDQYYFDWIRNNCWKELEAMNVMFREDGFEFC